MRKSTGTPICPLYLFILFDRVITSGVHIQETGSQSPVLLSHIIPAFLLQYKKQSLQYAGHALRQDAV